MFGGMNKKYIDFQQFLEYNQYEVIINYSKNAMSVSRYGGFQ